MPLPISPSAPESLSPCKSATPGDFDSGVQSAAGAGRRKVLGDLVCNDSPVVGLIPGLADFTARTPFSNIKSGLGSQKRVRRPFALTEHESKAGSTPSGENILRSQVQLLLQKVESENHAIKNAPSLRAYSRLHNFMDSPALKHLAPTPLNTPWNNVAASANVAEVPPISGTSGSSGVQKIVFKPVTVEGSADNPEVDGSGIAAYYRAKLHRPQAVSSNVEDTDVKLVVDIKITPTSDVVPPQCYGIQSDSSKAQITITESVNSGRDIQIMQATPLISEDLYHAGIADLSLGKKTTRILQFESPDKSSSTDESSSPCPCESLYTVQERDEDEASEWSVLVNVSSPTGKHEESELCADSSGDSYQCSVLEHLQRKCLGSNKVELLWSAERMDNEVIQKQGESKQKIGPMDNSAAGECADESWVDCYERYFDMYPDAEGDQSKGLPRSEGKHILFVYDSDGEDIIQETVTCFKGTVHQPAHDCEALGDSSSS